MEVLEFGLAAVSFPLVECRCRGMGRREKCYLAGEIGTRYT